MKVEVKDVSYSYGDTPVFSHLSFGVDKGEILAVLGPNGIGKTTLMKCLLKLRPFASGSYVHQGIADGEFYRKVGYVPQARSQTFPYTCFETVLAGRGAWLGLFATPKEKDRQIALAAMERAGISHLKDKTTAQISGGELQLVLIARALAAKPEILVMDEPETGLDLRNQVVILDLMAQLRKEGMTILFNTHYPEHACRVADRVLLMKKDGTALFGKADDVLQEAAMADAFGVQIKIREVEGYRVMIPVTEEV